MDINVVFPSKYISSSDLSGGEITVAIEHVAMETMADGKVVPVVYFQGGQKGLVLNKGNATGIGDMYGAETDAWPGKQLTLFVIWTEFQGKPVQGIRVRAPQTQPLVPTPQGAPPPVPDAAPITQAQSEGLTNEQILSDSIPF